MSDPTAGSGAHTLPESPSLEWLRGEAKRQLAELRRSKPAARLAEAQLLVARGYGFSSWRALKAHIDGLTLEGQLADAARSGNAAKLAALLDAHPELLQIRLKPYSFTLLHAGAAHLPVVQLLLKRGLDPNVTERGDNTYPMHWAAAAGRLDVVRTLADAGGNVRGPGDDHELDIIGWASCWDGGDDDAHRAVTDFLVSRGAEHHIFSAIALDLEDEVRRIVARDPAQLSRRQSRNEDNQLPLHFAVRKNKPRMVELLLELGADPLGIDATGYTAAAYATSPEIDAPVMRRIHAMTSAELDSALRGQRAPQVKALDIMAALALRDTAMAETLWERKRGVGATAGLLPLMAKRGDAAAAQWLLSHGVDPNEQWSHWGAMVTALHMAAMGNHPDVVARLLDAGADISIKDSMHDGDALGWAEFFGRVEIGRLIRARGHR